MRHERPSAAPLVPSFNKCLHSLFPWMHFKKRLMIVITCVHWWAEPSVLHSQGPYFFYFPSWLCAWCHNVIQCYTWFFSLLKGVWLLFASNPEINKCVCARVGVTELQETMDKSVFGHVHVWNMHAYRYSIAFYWFLQLQVDIVFTQKCQPKGGGGGSGGPSWLLFISI